MGIPEHIICLLRNLYAGQEATVRTGHGTTDWFQIGKEVHQGCILSPCLFNLYAEYIMQSAGLDEARTGTKIAWRIINNLRYADDITLRAKGEEELKNLLMRVKDKGEKAGLKLNIQKTNAPWKESYDQPRQHIKKQRHRFADKGLYIHSYGFSSSQVPM